MKFSIQFDKNKKINFINIYHPTVSTQNIVAATWEIASQRKSSLKIDPESLYPLPEDTECFWQAVQAIHAKTNTRNNAQHELTGTLFYQYRRHIPKSILTQWLGGHFSNNNFSQHHDVCLGYIKGAYQNAETGSSLSVLWMDVMDSLSPQYDLFSSLKMLSVLSEFILARDASLKKIWSEDALYHLFEKTLLKKLFLFYHKHDKKIHHGKNFLGHKKMHIYQQASEAQLEFSKEFAAKLKSWQIHEAPPSGNQIILTYDGEINIHELMKYLPFSYRAQPPNLIFRLAYRRKGQHVRNVFNKEGVKLFRVLVDDMKKNIRITDIHIEAIGIIFDSIAYHPKLSIRDILGTPDMLGQCYSMLAKSPMAKKIDTAYDKFDEHGTLYENLQGLEAIYVECRKEENIISDSNHAFINAQNAYIRFDKARHQKTIAFTWITRHSQKFERSIQQSKDSHQTSDLEKIRSAEALYKQLMHLLKNHSTHLTLENVIQIEQDKRTIRRAYKRWASKDSIQGECHWARDPLEQMQLDQQRFMSIASSLESPPEVYITPQALSSLHELYARFMENLIHLRHVQQTDQDNTDVAELLGLLDSLSEQLTTAYQSFSHLTSSDLINEAREEKEKSE